MVSLNLFRCHTRTWAKRACGLRGGGGALFGTLLASSWLARVPDQAKALGASKQANMSWMKGDLLSKTRRLVGGLASRGSVWLKAMEAFLLLMFDCILWQITSFPRSNGNLKKIVLPEDPYVRGFARTHPEARLVDPNKVSAFIPDPARVYGCRVLELTKNAINEDDAMSVANVRAFF
ncbi:unnamed protein product [Eruca vesicaria subsp. sativa]|uniref:Small ribosomal subunit protein mS23 n=1 Tax=Eruca vesicaria subsp. sativa TaxID=29727 RepID=A0ABC8KFQ6_ERUVS|nr:unnamed protein product [Eruca vesicaria subsp. sativa]